jgi:hypothetical protein
MAIRAILLVALTAFLFTGIVRADTDKSSYFIVSYSRPKPLNSSKESLIKDGMTLKMIVDNLGPGWMAPNEGVGVIQWFFDDGRALAILPDWDDTEIVTYKGKGGLSRMWWSH